MFDYDHKHHLFCLFTIFLIHSDVKNSFEEAKKNMNYAHKFFVIVSAYHTIRALAAIDFSATVIYLFVAVRLALTLALCIYFVRSHTNNLSLHVRM